MKTAVYGIESQPGFPNEDLTEDNAALLELMLANDEWLQQGHEAAEGTSDLFRTAHPNLNKAGARLNFDSANRMALSHGISTFEAISTMVCATPQGVSMFHVVSNSAALTDGMRETSVRRYFNDAYDSFRDSTPLAAETVRITAHRLFPAFTEYAVLGAAISRQFELD